MPADGEMVIDSDIPCAQCGYNLRTLGREGRCPECGEEIWPSIEKFTASVERWPPLTAETAAGLARRVEGCVLCILAIAMNQIFWFAFAGRLQWYDPKWKLRFCCTVVVILCWGMLKLARPADRARRHFGITSVSVTAALLLPAIAVYEVDFERQFSGFMQRLIGFSTIVLWIGAAVSAPLSLVALLSWSRRGRRPVVGTLLWLCFMCNLVAAAVIGSELGQRSFRSSISLVTELPVPLLGVPSGAIGVYLLLTGQGHPGMWLILPVNLAQLCTAGVLVVLARDFANARRLIRLSLRDRNVGGR